MQQQQQPIYVTPQQYQQISQQPPQLLQYSSRGYEQQVPIQVTNQQKIHVPLKVHRQETVPVFYRQSPTILKQSSQFQPQQNVQYIVDSQPSARQYTQQNPQIQYVYAQQQQPLQQPQQNLTYVAKSMAQPIQTEPQYVYVQSQQPQYQTITQVTQPHEEVYIRETPQIQPVVYESINVQPNPEFKEEIIPFEAKKTKSITHQNYQSFTYSEKVPYTKTIVDYVPVQKVEYVPRERQITDYYEVEYQIDYVPTKVQEKVIEYIPQERIKETIQYKPVARQIIKEPKEVGGEQQQPPQGFYLTSPQVYDEIQPEQMGKMSKSYTYQPGVNEPQEIKETPIMVDQDKIVFENSENKDINDYVKKHQEKLKQAGHQQQPQQQQQQTNNIQLQQKDPQLIQSIVTHHTISNRKDFDPITGTFAKGSPFRKQSNEVTYDQQGNQYDKKLEFGSQQQQQ